MTCVNVFVYGTLKPGEANYQRYCAERMIESYPAVAFGRLFELSIGYPAMTTGKRSIQGFVLSFPDSQVLRELDELEDYHPERLPEKNEYQRQKIQTFSSNGQYLGMAWGYVMLPEKVELLGGVFLPSGYWTGK